MSSHFHMWNIFCSHYENATPGTLWWSKRFKTVFLRQYLYKLYWKSFQADLLAQKVSVISQMCFSNLKVYVSCEKERNNDYIYTSVSFDWLTLFWVWHSWMRDVLTCLKEDSLFSILCHVPTDLSSLSSKCWVWCLPLCLLKISQQKCFLSSLFASYYFMVKVISTLCSYMSTSLGSAFVEWFLSVVNSFSHVFSKICERGSLIAAYSDSCLVGEWGASYSVFNYGAPLMPPGDSKHFSNSSICLVHSSRSTFWKADCFYFVY